jgi:FkbM family methyltransferase
MKLSVRLKNRARDAAYRSYAAFVERFPRSDLSKPAHELECLAALCVDQTPRVRALGTEPLLYLDVGARNGLPRYVAHYGELFDSTLVEPEALEAERLRKLGYRVIAKCLGEAPGRTELKITRGLGASSERMPNPIIDSYMSSPRGNSSFQERREVVSTQDVEVTTVSTLCAADAPFDLVKLDTQGTEYEILRGFGDIRPLVVITEVSLVQYYEGQKTFYDIAPLLHDWGYMLYGFDVKRARPDGYRASRPTRNGLPLHGDVAFMPDWSREAGQALIRNRPRKYAALMLILGMEEVLRFVLDRLGMPEKDIIEKALAVPSSGTFAAAGHTDPYL